MANDVCSIYNRFTRYTKRTTCPRCGHERFTMQDDRLMARCDNYNCRELFVADVCTVLEAAPQDWYDKRCKICNRALVEAYPHLSAKEAAAHSTCGSKECIRELYSRMNKKRKGIPTGKRGEREDDDNRD